MRRITVKYAKKGMVLGASVYDSFGNLLLDSYIRLDDDCLKIMLNNGVGEILLDDWRVADVPVQPLVSPEIEGKAAQALRKLMLDNQGKSNISVNNLEQISRTINSMSQELALDSCGEASVTSICSEGTYIYVQPTKASSLCLLLGKRLGYTTSELTHLGIAALLKDVGYIAIPPESLHQPDLLTERELVKIRQHPSFGYELLNQHNITSGEIANAVLQHHERWNGSGYPYGLKKTEISRFAQIIAIADTYTALLSQRPGRKTYMPHEAIEYIMAYSGDQFSPDLVELFVRQVPCYPSGLTVKLNTKEIGIISDANLGFVGRPTVRICYDEDNGALSKPYDIDLSKSEYQHKLITKIMDYY